MFQVFEAALVVTQLDDTLKFLNATLTVTLTGGI